MCMHIYMHASVHNLEVKQQLILLINISLIVNNARYFHIFVGSLCFEVSLFRSPAHSSLDCLLLISYSLCILDITLLLDD